MKLTDKQRKKIIAEYVQGDGKVSIRLLAKKYGVSPTTISKILSDKESVQKLTDKKKENEMSMLAFLDSRSEKAQLLIDKILDTLPNDFAKAGMKQKAGLLKILSEVFAKPQEEKNNSGESSGQSVFEFVFKDMSIKDENDN